jgi:uncharacterized protein (DUF697 family)
LAIRPQDVLAVLRELRAGSGAERSLVVAGHPGLAGMLRRELVRGGDERAVRESGPIHGSIALVYVLAADAGDADVHALRDAERAGVPSVAVIVELDDHTIANPPYVLAGHVVRVPSGAGFPVDEIASVLARAIGGGGSALAARLPALRSAVVDELIRRHSRQNAVLGTVTGRSRAAMPLLTLDQVRLVLRIGAAYGFEIDRDRVPELLAVVAGGFGLRGAARAAIRLVPFSGWAVRGGVAYGGTRAIGEAARRYFEARAR